MRPSHFARKPASRRGLSCLSRLVLSRIALPLCLVFATAPESAAQTKRTPRESVLLERSDVSLMLLDVQVTDQDGAPIPGLTRDDFNVQLNGLGREIYSLDDFCPEPSATGTPPDTTGQRSAPSPDQPGVRFVLYLDLARMSLDARTHSIAIARRWVDDTMQDDDLVQLAAYSGLAGLVELTGFTADRKALRAGLDRLSDPSFVDAFAATRESRVASCISCCERCSGPCASCCSDCVDLRQEEYFHDRAALRALKWYVRGLDALPDRKALMLFYKSGGQFPGRAYARAELPTGGDGRSDSPTRPDRNHLGASSDHLLLMDDLAAEATIAQTVLFPIYVGDVGDPARSEAINFGANLADFTGGQHSRSAADAVTVARQAGRDWPCVYRIGLSKPPRARRDRFRAVVSVRGQRLPNQFRVQFLDDNDRWWRRAQSVLESPEKWSDVQVHADAVPSRATRKGWDLNVRVALDMKSLQQFPTAGRQQAEWEVGALLHRPGKTRAWEMLGVSTVRSDAESPAGTFVVHRRSFLELPPGTYQLGAFVRDRAANVFGAAESVLTLPAPKQGGTVGPVLMLSRRKHLDSTLPLLREGKDADAPRARVHEDGLPTVTRVRKGESVEFRSWICPGGRTPPPPREVLRFLVQGGDRPLLRFGEANPADTGLCYGITDTLETALLEAGEYTYHVRYRADGSGAPLESELPFRIDLPVGSPYGPP